MSTCAVEGCDREAAKREWCNRHYRRWLKHGDPIGLGEPMRYAPGQLCALPECDRPVRALALCASHAARAICANRGPCTVDGCEREQSAGGLCNMHWKRKKKYGEVGPVGSLVARGTGRSRTTDGYVRVYAPGHPTATADGWALEHRYVMWEHVDGFDLSLHVHHKNHDRTDNSIDNLELLTPDVHAEEHAANRRSTDRTRAAELYRSGLSTTEVAKALGTHSGNISRILREVGVPARTPAERRALGITEQGVAS